MNTLNITALLSQRVNQMAEAETLAMSKKTRELAAQGYDIINLTLGEPDFQTPAHIKDAAKKALDEGFTYYPPVAGYPELRKAIAEKLKHDNGIDWQSENIVVSTGAKQSIANVCMALLNAGDEVIIFTPYWVSYREIVKLAEGNPIFLAGTPENDYKVTPEQLAKAITPRTKAILYSSPSNPTGATYTQAEIEALAAVLIPHEQVYVIADEIYEHILFEPSYFSIGSISALKERVITINGFSKAYAMTGWRMGYSASNKEIAQACEKIQGQITSGACTITQRASIAAVAGDQAPTKEMCQAYLRRRDLMHSLMSEIPNLKIFKPQGAFYLFPDVSAYFGKSDGEQTIQNANDLSMYLLYKARVASVAGSAFGAENNIRFSFATSDEKIVEAVKRIKEALAMLK
ncbi:MAG: pyridoxal phosphate-dependent aminotransferase [Cytophagales bacterium]|nr:MAG: pyridoxal phosphate-dependent aminotransferase [Cytophagales bacterium]